MSARHWSDGWTRDHLIDEIEQLRVEIRELRGVVGPEGERAMLRAEIERLRAAVVLIASGGFKYDSAADLIRIARKALEGK